jgi:hypothetical protein
MLPNAVRVLSAFSFVVLGWLTAGSAPLFAQGLTVPLPTGVDALPTPDAIALQTESDLLMPSRSALPAAWMIEPPAVPLRLDAARPSGASSARLTPVMTSLYVSFVALQGLDVHSTLAAVRHGARETNPAMAALADRPAALVALKAGTAAGVLYMTERVRRRSRLGALLMMVGFNSAYATVVANNYRVLNRLEHGR